MAYRQPRKIDTGFPKKDWYIVDAIQNKINRFLYEIKDDEGLELTEPKILTILIRKDKEHHFHFLRDETEFRVKGRWQDTTHKPHHFIEEANAEITVQFLDNKKETVSKKLIKLFEAYNKQKVGEKVLYVTTAPIEETSLNLKKGRE
jgi:hypothetical protein